MANESSQDQQSQPHQQERFRWKVFKYGAAWLAVIATLVVGIFALIGARDGDVRRIRAEAYASYIEAHERSHEFMWRNAHWAGTDVVDAEGVTRTNNRIPDDKEEAFWAEASQLQADLASRNLSARMLAQGGEVDRVFKELHVDQGEVFLQFRCMAEAIKSDCMLKNGVVSPATNREIVDLLRGWSTRAYDDKEELVTIAGDQLTKWFWF